MTPSDATRDALRALGGAGPPQLLGQFNQRLHDIAAVLGVPTSRVAILVSSLIIAQALPPGCVIKGGFGMKIRLGEHGTRATADLDVATADTEALVDALTEALSSGWGHLPPSKGTAKRNPQAPGRIAFTGSLKPQKAASPASVPPRYVMRPFLVSLKFDGKPIRSVKLEVSGDELDGIKVSAEVADLAPQLHDIAAALGFGPMDGAILISTEQQIAQKIHAVTAPEELRAHDLIDLQLLAAAVDSNPLDLACLKDLCQRTFRWRTTPGHTWPPTAPFGRADALRVPYSEAFAEATAALPTGNGWPADQLLASVGEALDWLDTLIEAIVRS